MKNGLFILAFLFSLSAKGQTGQADKVISQLMFFGDVMVNAEDPDNRQIAYQNFNKLFDEFVATDDFQSADLSSVKWISQLEPEDKSFQLYSWQLKLSEEVYQYKSYLIKEDGNVIPFNTKTITEDELTSLTLAPDEWYGCLYYNLMKQTDTEYVLFGFDGSGKSVNHKIADVLVIGENGVTLGKEIFEDKENKGTFQTRLRLSYSSDANVNLNYNPSMKMIVHDHLTTRMGRLEGQGPVNVPDGTYEGYSYTDNKWIYKEKLFDHIYEEAPRPKPVLDKKKKEGKDLFGRS